jgi:Transposase DDE domain
MIVPPPNPPQVPATPPTSDFAHQVLERLPLAQAALTLLRYATPTDWLAKLFDHHRGRCYQARVTFPELVAWLLDALVEHEGSGRQAHLTRPPGAQDACDEAFYGKLRRMPVPLSEAFLQGTTTRLVAVRPALPAHVIPTSLAAFEPLILDGKSLKQVAKRLKPCRGIAGKLLGGKLLVAYRLRDGLIVDMAADLDGETNESKLIPALVPRLQAQSGLPKLFVGDRLYCALASFHQMALNSGRFVVRYSSRLSFTADPSRPAVEQCDASGRTIREEWGWAGKPREKLRGMVRKITLTRPGEPPLELVTNLDDAVSYPARDLLDLYRIRWTIESVFQKVTKMFHLDQCVGTTAQATIFQAAMCFVLANAARVMMGYVAEGRSETPGASPVAAADVSEHQVWKDWHRQLVAVKELVPLESILGAIPRVLDASEVVRLLRSWLGGLWKAGWKKTRNKTPRSHSVNAKKRGAHTSVHRRRIAAAKSKL